MPKVQTVEVRACTICLQPVIYWDGDFRHLTVRCPNVYMEGRPS
jgi:hypothetical protein